MNMRFFIVCLFIIISLLSCAEKQQVNPTEKAELKKLVAVTEICLLPFEDVSEQEITELKNILEVQFTRLLPGQRHFTVLKKDSLPEDAFVKNRNRYKSSILLNYERKLLKGNEIIIGITHKDICADVHNKKDYGIIGISLLKKQVCIVSDKRLSNKMNFWKPIIHEYIHTYYGAQHCSNDDNSCLMQDCKGKGNFNIKDNLCSSCKAKTTI